MAHRALNVVVNDLPVILLFRDPADNREVFISRDQLTGIPTSVAVRGGDGTLVDVPFLHMLPAPLPAPVGSYLRTFAGPVEGITYQVTLVGEGRQMSGAVDTTGP